MTSFAKRLETGEQDGLDRADPASGRISSQHFMYTDPFANIDGQPRPSAPHSQPPACGAGSCVGSRAPTPPAPCRLQLSPPAREKPGPHNFSPLKENASIFKACSSISPGCSHTGPEEKAIGISFLYHGNLFFFYFILLFCKKILLASKDIVATTSPDSLDPFPSPLPKLCNLFL